MTHNTNKTAAKFMDSLFAGFSESVLNEEGTLNSRARFVVESAFSVRRADMVAVFGNITINELHALVKERAFSAACLRKGSAMSFHMDGGKRIIDAIKPTIWLTEEEGTARGLRPLFSTDERKRKVTRTAYREEVVALYDAEHKPMLNEDGSQKTRTMWRKEERTEEVALAPFQRVKFTARECMAALDSLAQEYASATLRALYEERKERERARMEEIANKQAQKTMQEGQKTDRTKGAPKRKKEQA